MDPYAVETEQDKLKRREMSPKALEGTFKVPRFPILYRKNYALKQTQHQKNQSISFQPEQVLNIGTQSPPYFVSHVNQPNKQLFDKEDTAMLKLL